MAQIIDVNGNAVSGSSDEVIVALAPLVAR